MSINSTANGQRCEILIKVTLINLIKGDLNLNLQLEKLHFGLGLFDL